MDKILETLCIGWDIDPTYPAASVDCLNKGISLTNVEKQRDAERLESNEKELEYQKEISRQNNIIQAVTSILTDKEESQLQKIKLRKLLKKRGVTLEHDNDAPYLSFKTELQQQ